MLAMISGSCTARTFVVPRLRTTALGYKEEYELSLVTIELVSIARLQIYMWTGYQEMSLVFCQYHDYFSRTPTPVSFSVLIVLVSNCHTC